MRASANIESKKLAIISGLPLFCAILRGPLQEAPPLGVERGAKEGSQVEQEASRRGEASAACSVRFWLCEAAFGLASTRGLLSTCVILK